jgi:putative glutamine amidotransferase
VALGGTLNPDVVAGGLNHRPNASGPLDAQYAPAHCVSIVPGGVLSALLDAREVMVNSLHSQGIARLAPGLSVEARAPDGLVEAVSLPAPNFVLGVQWHPEWRAAGDPVSKALFAAFGRAAGSRSHDYGKNGPDKRKIR